MKTNRISILIAAIALLCVPAIALAVKPADKPAKGGGNAYGKYCQTESKKHVKGEKGTAFSRCVKAMKVAVQEDASPKEACKTLSKKHVKGEKGTPYSRCIVAAAQAKKDAEEPEETPTPTPTETATPTPTV